MMKRYFIVSYRDESQVRLKEKDGMALQDGLVSGSAKYFKVRDRVYSTQGIVSVLPAEMEEIILQKLELL